jgi:hypothetical protein
MAKIEAVLYWRRENFPTRMSDAIISRAQLTFQSSENESILLELNCGVFGIGKNVATSENHQNHFVKSPHSKALILIPLIQINSQPGILYWTDNIWICFI